MKIALIVPGGVDRSGEYRVIPAFIALIARLARSVDLQVFALAQEPRAASWELAGARVHNIGDGFNSVRAVAAIARAHRQGRFALVHSLFSGRCGLVSALAARACGIPYAIHLAGGELAAIRDIRYGGFLRLRWRLAEPRLLRGAAVVTAASAPMVAAAARLGVVARRVPLGVDLARFPPCSPAARDSGCLALVQLASINRVKDQSTLLAAARRLLERSVDFTLDIIGEDTLSGELQRLAARLRLEERVRFHGFLTQAAAREIVMRSHLHVVSSRHEAGPLAMLEAAVCGVPTVGTAVGHVAEWAPDASVAVPVGDAPALAQAIEGLLVDEPRRLALALAAHARALAADADFTARSFLEMYAAMARVQ